MAIRTDPDYYSIRGFYPLSLIHFFDYVSMDKYRPIRYSL